MMTKEGVNLNKFQIMVDTLSNAMILERIHNIHQECGNEAWSRMTNKEILFDLYYHVGKLQAAIRANDKNLMLEHIGDIGNYLGFLILNENLNEVLNATISESSERD